MRPLCPDEGRGIGLSWLRSSQISFSNRAGPADRENGDHSGTQVCPVSCTLNHQGFAFDAGSNAGLGKVHVCAR
jgi:hypothetical protein